MFSKKEILLWTFAFIIGVFLAWSCKLEAVDVQLDATDIKKLEEPIEKDKKVSKEHYPNFLLYNSTQSCMRGIVDLLITFNPQLRNQIIPPAVQQQILRHCTCVVDKSRMNYSIQEYYKNAHNFLWIRKVWGSFGNECTKDGYLAGLGIQYPEEKVKEEDNKTESPKPESKVEEELSDEPTIFQG